MEFFNSVKQIIVFLIFQLLNIYLRKIYKKLNINNRTEAASIVKKFENQE